MPVGVEPRGDPTDLGAVELELRLLRACRSARRARARRRSARSGCTARPARAPRHTPRHEQPAAGSDPAAGTEDLDPHGQVPMGSQAASAEERRDLHRGSASSARRRPPVSRCRRRPVEAPLESLGSVWRHAGQVDRVHVDVRGEPRGELGAIPGQEIDDGAGKIVVASAFASSIAASGSARRRRRSRRCRRRSPARTRDEAEQRRLLGAITATTRSAPAAGS